MSTITFSLPSEINQQFINHVLLVLALLIWGEVVEVSGVTYLVKKLVSFMS